MATGTELAETNSVELAILGEGDYSIPVEDADAISREIVGRILDAESDTELFEQPSATSPRDMLGEPFFVKNVRWNKSRYGEGGPTVFAVITATQPDDGSEFVITCGSRNVMAQLFRAAKLGKLPLEYPVKFEENKTASGTGALWLTKA